MRSFGLLGDVPYAGRQRDELRPAYRSFPVGEYLTFYRVEKPGDTDHARSARTEELEAFSILICQKAILQSLLRTGQQETLCLRPYKELWCRRDSRKTGYVKTI